MIIPKHDPRNLPSASTAFRSTLPSDFPAEASEYYNHIAYSGTALYHVTRKEYSYVVGVPVYLNAGSAVPSGSLMPTRPMDSYVVAKAFGDEAHVFADDNSRIESMLSGGTYQRLPTCSSANCDNLCIPGSNYCSKHISPPLAE
jgi:hypothetical protein